MAVRHGYGKIAGADALVFAYDTGDIVNSYKGEPVNNLHAVDPGNVHTSFNAVGTTAEEVDFITPFGNKAWKITIPSSGTNGFSSTRANGNTTTINRDGTNYFHGCYVWVANNQYSTWSSTAVYKYTTGTNGWSSWSYKPTFDKKDTAGRVWKLWGAVTSITAGGTGNEYHAFFKNGTLSQDLTFYVVAPMMLEGKNHPVQFTAGERSDSGSLLDLTGNSTIDLSNAGFNSDAQIDFDGTGDFFDVDGIADFQPNNTTDGFTVEYVFKSDTVTSTVFVGNLDSTNGWFQAPISSGNNIGAYLFLNGPGVALRTNDNFHIDSGNINKFHHVVMSLKWSDPANSFIIIDGVDQTATSSNVAKQSTSGIPSPGLRIGKRGSSTWPANGQIPVIKIYNRALTAGEIKNNYSHYKNRFGI